MVAFSITMMTMRINPIYLHYQCFSGARNRVRLLSRTTNKGLKNLLSTSYIWQCIAMHYAQWLYVTTGFILNFNYWMSQVVKRRKQYDKVWYRTFSNQVTNTIQKFDVIIRALYFICSSSFNKFGCCVRNWFSS